MNRALVSVTTAALLCTAVSIASAQQAFKTPDEAASALVSAANAGDPKAIVTVLGLDGADIASSGDEVADGATRQKFVVAYDAKHLSFPKIPSGLDSHRRNVRLRSVSGAGFGPRTRFCAINSVSHGGEEYLGLDCA